MAAGGFAGGSRRTRTAIRMCQCPTRKGEVHVSRSQAVTFLTVLALAVAGGVVVPGPFATAPAEPAFLTQQPQGLPETVGTKADPATRERAMGALQTALAARQVEQALRQEVVVTLSSAERKTIDEPGSNDGKYLVGVNKSIGRTVDFSQAVGLGERTRPLAAGAARGDGQGGFVWTAAVRAPGATAMRVRLTGLDLPEGAELYVYNLAGQAFGPYTGRGPLGTGELYTNTVFGEQLVLQLQQPAGTAARAATAHRGGRRDGPALRGAALRPRRRFRRRTTSRRCAQARTCAPTTPTASSTRRARRAPPSTTPRTRWRASCSPRGPLSTSAPAA